MLVYSHWNSIPAASSTLPLQDCRALIACVREKPNPIKTLMSFSFIVASLEVEDTALDDGGCDTEFPVVAGFSEADLLILGVADADLYSSSNLSTDSGSS